jgi:low temperature requirement protein LtrA
MSTHLDHDVKVTPIELFFDLVFVFAITQVTLTFANDLTWGGFGRGLILLTVLWWAWAAYSWLTNAIHADDLILARFVIFGAMGAMLVAAIAAPNAFGDEALLFGIAYFIVRLLHIVLYAVAAEDQTDREAILRLAPGMLAGSALLIAASAFDGAMQAGLWLAAAAIDFGTPLIRGNEGFTVHPHHFVERHGLVIIIALGESIVVIGAGATGLSIDAATVATALLGLTVSILIWWLYFDVVTLAAERRLERAQGAERARLARDSYSYLHLLIVGGIILIALGIKIIIQDPTQALETIPAVALCGGVAVHLLGHVGYRYRDYHTLSKPRSAGVIGALALIPVATRTDGLVSLALVAAVLAAVAISEQMEHAQVRAIVREHGTAEHS